MIKAMLASMTQDEIQQRDDAIRRVTYLDPNNYGLVEHWADEIRDRTVAARQAKAAASNIAHALIVRASYLFPKVEAVVTNHMGAELTVIQPGRIGFVEILRAAKGGAARGLDMINNDMASVHPLGLSRKRREDGSFYAVKYFEARPKNPAEIDHFSIIDPMLASAATSIEAIRILVNEWVVPIKKISFLSMFAAPEGVHALCDAYPGLAVFIASMEARLNEHGYIEPGIGDAGEIFDGRPASR